MVAKGEKQWRRQVSKCCLVEEEAEIAIIPTMYTLRFAEDVFFGIFPMQKIPNNWGICRFFVFLIGGSCEAFQLHVGLPQIAPGLHVSHQHSRVLCWEKPSERMCLQDTYSVTYIILESYIELKTLGIMNINKLDIHRKKHVDGIPSSHPFIHMIFPYS